MRREATVELLNVKSFHCIVSTGMSSFYLAGNWQFGTKRPFEDIEEENTSLVITAIGFSRFILCHTTCTTHLC